MPSAGSRHRRTRPSGRSTRNGRSAADATPRAHRTGPVALVDSARHGGLPSALANAVLSALPSSIAVLDRTGAIVAVNEAWKRFARENGDPSLAERSVGLNYLDICRQAAGPSSEGSREIAEGIQAVLEGSRSLDTLEYPCHSPTERRWFSLHVEPLPDGQGAVVSHTNISERKQAEQAEAHVRRQIKAVRAAAAALATGVDLSLGKVQVQVSAGDLIELAPDAMVLCNHDGEIVLVNQQAEAVFGYARGSLLGHAIESLLPERFHDMHAQHRRRFFTQPAHYPIGSRLEVYGRRRDGSEFPVEITLSLLVTTAGTFALSAIRDLTERKRLEAAEHERACTLEATIEAMTDGVCIYDPAGRVMRMNAAARAMLGLEQPLSHYTMDGLVAQMPLYDDKGQPLPAHVWPHIQVLLSGEALTGADAQDVLLRSLDGHEWRLSATAAPVRDRDGNIIAVVVVMRDVTRRRRLERELAKRMSQIEGIFETAADGIALYDEQGHILRANQALVDLTAVDRKPEYFAGLPAERTKLLHLHDPATGRLLPVEERPVMRALRGEVLAGATAMDVRIHALDGREVDVSVSATPLRDEAGRITGAVVIMRDVTERRRLERDAAERASLIECIFDTMADGIALCDGEGRLLATNRILGMVIARERYPDFPSLSPAERAELLHVRDADGRPISPGGLPDERALRGETLKDNTSMDLRVRMGDGSDVELNVTAAPVRDPAGRATGAVTVWRDVTERRRLERERALIMNTVSHELKTPLNIMQMGGELIRRYAERHAPPEMETLLETLEVVNSATTLMRRLVNDLVDVARMEMGHLTLSLAPVDVAELARRVAQDQMRLTGRSVIVEAPKHLVVASGDALRIIQVLTNLLSNAFKYSPADSPVRLRLDRAHGQARFEVQDEGSGIPREVQTRLFERFYQVPGITVQQGSGVGLGLGLYICRQLVELHGGRIGVESEVGQGSTFWIVLPLAQSTP